MTDIKFRDDFDVDLVSWSYGDEAILRAMLVSTLKDAGDIDPNTEQNKGRINFLMKNRHGTPFEHTQMVFRVSAPIFVFREWHRHRIGISINEQSGRYTEFEPVFYVPNKDRAITQTGKPGAYVYEKGDTIQTNLVQIAFKNQAENQWQTYQNLIDNGIALEVARMHLGVNIYSTMYWTCNARSMMSFLSLRRRIDKEFINLDPYENGSGNEGEYYINPQGAMFPSKPMWEIDRCAQMMEEKFASVFPVTYDCFIRNGRVSP